MFFLGIQPNTDLEHRLLEEGYLSAGYNPLMLTPRSIKKLLYNPAPLNKFIAKACLAAWHKKHGSRDPRPWSGSLSQTEQPAAASAGYADGNLIRGIEQNSGRQTLLNLRTAGLSQGEQDIHDLPLTPAELRIRMRRI